MLNNIPKYTTDAIDGIAVDAIDSLMYKNCCDVLAIMDDDGSIKTFEEKKRNIAKVLRLIESTVSMPSLDWIIQAHVLYNTSVITNYAIISEVLLSYNTAFHDAPDIRMSPFSELVQAIDEIQVPYYAE